MTLKRRTTRSMTRARKQAVEMQIKQEMKEEGEGEEGEGEDYGEPENERKRRKKGDQKKEKKKKKEEHELSQKKRCWSSSEDASLQEAVKRHTCGGNVIWGRVSEHIKMETGAVRSLTACRKRSKQLQKLVAVYDTPEKLLARDNMVMESCSRPWTQEEDDQLWEYSQTHNLKYASGTERSTDW